MTANRHASQELTSVVEQISAKYLATIESLNEELGGYKDKI
jgi:hypothetical protein